MIDNSRPLISVIVPVYNVERYLRRCLDSICGQSYRNLEIICVDDGSPDNSIDILREYEKRDARIRIIRQANAGLSAARNSALEIAQGEWVMGVDSDDWLDTSILEKAVQCLDDEVDMLCFGVEVVWDGPPGVDDSILKECFSFERTGKVKANYESMRNVNVTYGGKMWRRSLIERYHMRFAAGYKYEDCGFYTLFMPDCRYAYILNDIGYYYAQRADSIMGETRGNPERQLEYYDQMMYVAAQYTLHNRWSRDNGYFGYLMSCAFYHIRAYGDARIEEFRRSIFRLVSENKLIAYVPRACVALLFSPFRPAPSLARHPSKWMRFLSFPHYLAGMVRYVYAAYFR